MTNLGRFDPEAWPPPVAGPPSGPPPPGAGQDKDIPIWVLGLAGLLAVALAIGAGVMILRPPGGTPGATGRLPPAAVPSYPATWNPRIKPIADEASLLRGLEFQHPVPVRFLPPAKFEKSLVTDDADLSKKDRAQLEHEAGLLRALGLVSGNLDLAKAFNGATSGATLAYYSFADQRITVRGKIITPAVKATLIHELTHVLQDQNFQVGKRLAHLRKQSDRSNDSAEEVYQAIVEGDAERVRHLYEASLPAKQQQALAAAEDRESAAAQRRVSGVSPFILTLMASPYALGEGVVEQVAANGGNDAVDALFHKPPTHESALVDPYRLVTHQAGAAKVAVPALGPGEKRFDSGEFGELTWYLMLAERLPLPQALAAADGWGGDSYVAFARGSTACTKMSFAGRTPADTSRMTTSLLQWAATTPGEQTVDEEGRLVHVESCDPGTGVSGGADTSEQALSLVADRAALSVVLQKGGVPGATARCTAGKLVDTYSVAQLNDPTFGKDDPAIIARIQQLAAACR